MNPLNSILILAAALLAVFLESSFQGVRHLFGAQVDLLPALMVYASLSANLPTLVLLALLGGLGFDSLSANPLGISVLPLFIVGLLIYRRRNLILRDQLFAQWILGLAASAVVPLLTLLLLFTAGKSPLIGWGSFWQFIVMTVGGGIAAPIFFKLFGFLENALNYRRNIENSFRPDREIRRGK